MEAAVTAGIDDTDAIKPDILENEIAHRVTTNRMWKFLLLLLT